MLRDFWRSLKHAWRGVFIVASKERNFRIQLFIGLIVLIAAFLFSLDTWERVLLILLVAAVLVLEILNSIMERMSDALKPRFHPMVKDMKDLMAGAVLLTAFTAIIIALLIFLPHFSQIS